MHGWPVGLRPQDPVSGDRRAGRVADLQVGERVAVELGLCRGDEVDVQRPDPDRLGRGVHLLVQGDVEQVLLQRITEVVLQLSCRGVDHLRLQGAERVTELGVAVQRSGQAAPEGVDDGVRDGLEVGAEVGVGLGVRLEVQERERLRRGHELHLRVGEVGVTRGAAVAGGAPAVHHVEVDLQAALADRVLGLGERVVDSALQLLTAGLALTQDLFERAGQLRRELLEQVLLAQLGRNELGGIEGAERAGQQVAGLEAAGVAEVEHRAAVTGETRAGGRETGPCRGLLGQHPTGEVLLTTRIGEGRLGRSRGRLVAVGVRRGEGAAALPVLIGDLQRDCVGLRLMAGGGHGGRSGQQTESERTHGGCRSKIRVTHDVVSLPRFRRTSALRTQGAPPRGSTCEVPGSYVNQP